MNSLDPPVWALEVCGTHVSVETAAVVSRNSFVNDNGQEIHISNMPAKVYGINQVFVEEIDEALDRGVSPDAILAMLRESCNGRDRLISNLPTTLQITNRKYRLLAKKRKMFPASMNDTQRQPAEPISSYSAGTTGSSLKTEDVVAERESRTGDPLDPLDSTSTTCSTSPDQAAGAFHQSSNPFLSSASNAEVMLSPTFLPTASRHPYTLVAY